MRAWIAGDGSSRVVYESAAPLAVVIREAADGDPAVGTLLEVLVAPARADRAGHDALGERCGRDHVQALRAHARRVVRHELRQRAVRGHHDALRVHRAAAGAHGEAAVARGVERLRNRAALEDAHAALLDGAREGPHPARRVHRRVGRREHAHTTGPPHDRGQIGLVDPLGRQAVGAHRLVLARARAPARPAPRSRAGSPRARNARSRRSRRRSRRCAARRPAWRGRCRARPRARTRAPRPGGRRRARHEESAVAAAGAARRRARLDDDAIHPALGQVPRAREPGDARADHETSVSQSASSGARSS